MAKSSGRAAQRAFERAAKNALLCKVPLTEWLTMPRVEKKRRLSAAKGGRRG